MLLYLELLLVLCHHRQHVLLDVKHPKYPNFVGGNTTECFRTLSCCGSSATTASMSSSLSNTRAGPRNCSPSLPVILATEPSGARLPYRICTASGLCASEQTQACTVDNCSPSDRLSLLAMQLCRAGVAVDLEPHDCASLLSEQAQHPYAHALQTQRTWSATQSNSRMSREVKEPSNPIDPDRG